MALKWHDYGVVADGDYFVIGVNVYIAFLSFFLFFQTILPESFRELFEQKLFIHQTGLIEDQKEYNINELGIVLKYKRNCYAYVIAVADYSVAFFNKKYCGSKKQLDEKEDQLLNSIFAFNLRDPVLEYAKTKDLLEKANDAYYKKLPLSKRLLISITRNILAPIFG